MKMYKIIIAAFILMGLSYGCSKDLLEKSDPGAGNVEGFYTSEEQLILGINGVYAGFQGSWWGGSFIHIQPHLDAATDNAVICCPWEYGFPAVGLGTMNPTTGGIVGWKWDFGYQAITRVNQMLQLIDEGIPGLSTENATKWIAELRFLRGFIYNEMLTVYGGVPLITTVLSPEEALQIGRASAEETLTQANADLQFAADNLLTTPNNDQRGRPTKQAALSYIGKALLFAGKHAEAAAVFKQVIDMEGDVVALDPDYASLFNGSNEGSPEIIFAFQAVGNGVGEGSFFQVHYAPQSLPSGTTSGGWNSMQYTRNLIDDYYMTDGQPISTSPLYDPENIFKDRDPRLAGTFLRPGDVWSGHVMEAGRNFTYNGQTPHEELAVEVILKKWSSEATLNNGDTDVDFILLRYADVLLMYAEAQNEAVGPDASVYEAVNKVRARAGMPNFAEGMSQEEMRQEIRHERRIEFVMEGTRYYDLIRWRVAEDVIVNSVEGLQNRVFDPSKNYLWPIPQSAVDSNPDVIKQNPGY